ncbi:MAG TPA: roadblock/LC7 domain-containing protein [Gemmatimonadaceae bacterium]|nr:roadblock/LC7 domain-containing protein [Gemmatimonadaceae bacterium]
MVDDVSRLSDELARDPSSLVFVPLGEALRRQGQLDLAQRVAVRGLERHPHLADGHDLLARIAVDRGELERAFDEWDMVLRLADGHVGALRGMGFICFQQGRLAEAEGYLGAAASAAPADEGIVQALANVRAALGPGQDGMSEPAREPATEPGYEGADEPVSAPTLDPVHDTRFLFADVLSDVDQTALLLDREGLVLGGAYLDYEGNDVAQEVGAELSGVTDAARRATRHLALGDWSSIVFETEVAVVAMAPSPDDGLLVLATSRATPLGLVRRLLDRCAERAARWLGERAA